MINTIRLSAAGLCLLAVSLPAQSTAPAPLKGTYALREQGVFATGQEFAALSSITFDGNGNAKGTQTMKGTSGTLDLSVTGVYSMSDDGTGTLSLTFPLSDANGDSATGVANYRLVRAGDSLRAIRSDVGVLSSVTMRAASTSGATKGQYLMSEGAIEGTANAFVSIQSLNLDGDSKVSGRAVSKGFGPEQVQDLVGAYTAGGDSSPGTLTLQTTSLNADGEPLVVTRTYRFLVTANRQLEAIRVDPGLVTAVEFSAVQ